MRLCLVSSEVAGFRGGGIGTYVVEAGKALRAAGHEPWLLTVDPGPDQRAALRSHPAFARVLFTGDGVEEPVRRYLRADAAYRHASSVHATLRATGVEFDYIEFPDYEAEGYVALREQALFGAYGATVLGVTLHSPTWEVYRFNEQTHLLQTAQRELCVLEDDAIRSAPLLCSPSTRLLEIVAGRLGFPAERGHVVRYPMALPAEPPSLPVRRAGLADLRVLYFGRIEPRKGVHHLVEAARLLPEVQFELVGRDATYSPYGTSFLAWLTPRLPPNVVVAPPLPRERLLERIAEVDVCVLPSVWDNWPNACIEAMAAGRVVVGGREGGMGEMIEPGRSGFLVDGSDPHDIARVLREEVGGALDRLDQIGAAAARRIRELSDPGRYVARIEQLVAGQLVAERSIALRSSAQRSTAQSRITTAARVTVVIGRGADREADVRTTTVAARAQTDIEVEVLITEPDRGLAEARGEFVLFVDAGDRPRPDCAATLVRALRQRPDLAGLVPDVALRDRGSLLDGTVANALPFERSLVLARPGAPEVIGGFRTATLRDAGIVCGAHLDLVPARSVLLGCAAAGLAVETMPRILLERDRVERGSWQRHVAQLGQLVRDRLPPGSAEDERRLLLAVVQSWGLGAMSSPTGEIAHRLDAILTRRTPRLARFLQRIAQRLLAAHGRRKARRL